MPQQDFEDVTSDIVSMGSQVRQTAAPRLHISTASLADEMELADVEAARAVEQPN